MLDNITQDYLKSILDYDPNTGLFTWKPRDNKNFNSLWSGKEAGCIDHYGYCVLRINKKSYKSHRLAFLYVYGEFPPSLIDHINGDPEDNRIINLRKATPSENLQNRKRAHSNNKTGLLGVYRHNQATEKFCAEIRINKKPKYLGIFDTKEQAHNAYLKAKRELHPYGVL